MMVAVSSGRIGIFIGSKLPESSKLVKRCSLSVSLGFAVPFPLKGRYFFCFDSCEFCLMFAL